VTTREVLSELILPARTESVGRARHEVLAMAGQLGIDGTGDLELITSELTSNAVTSSATEIRLRLSRGDAVVRLEVDDDGPGTPQVVEGSEAGGWGLHVVEEVSTAWGVIPLPAGGKTVWAEIPMDPFADAPRRVLHTDALPTAEMAPEWFRDALDSMLDLVALHRAVRDESGRIVDFEVLYTNPAATERNRPYGWPADISGYRLRDLHAPDRIDTMLQAWTTVVETGDAVLLDEVPLHASMAPNDLDACFTIAVSKFADGVLVVARDITDQLQARRHLDDVHRKFEAAQELAHIGTWGIDFATGVFSASAELGRIFGVEGGGDVGWHPGMIFDAIHPDDRERVQRAVDEAPARDGKLSTEARVLRPDGEVRILAVHARITYDDAGLPSGVWGTGQDVTEQRNAEHALQETTDELAREQTMVDRLQRAILPRLPEVDGLEVAARYLPAGTGARVGGDWYDLFLLDDGHVVFSIGDVAGHGIEAASLMAQLRNALRGAAYCGASPDEAIAAVDQLVADHADDDFATCIFGAIDLAAHRLVWTNAGHPPLLMVADGPAQYLAMAELPPLGVGLGVTRAKVHESPFPSGSLLLAYTDGLVEQPAEPLDLGLERLLGAVAVHHGDPLDELCEHLGMSMFAGRERRDDVCVLALRTGT
jgi:PAS domain S-box-containing protein